MSGSRARTSSGRCLRCGARNPATAAWCGQCHTQLATGREPAGTGPRPQPALSRRPAVTVIRPRAGATPDPDRPEPPAERVQAMLAELAQQAGGASIGTPFGLPPRVAAAAGAAAVLGAALLLMTLLGAFLGR